MGYTQRCFGIGIIILLQALKNNSQIVNNSMDEAINRLKIEFTYSGHNKGKKFIIPYGLNRHTL